MKILYVKVANEPDSSSFRFIDVITRLGEGQPHITETLPRLGQTLLQIRICDFLENCFTRFREVTLTLRDLVPAGLTRSAGAHAPTPTTRSPEMVRSAVVAVATPGVVTRFRNWIWGGNLEHKRGRGWRLFLLGQPDVL